MIKPKRQNVIYLTGWIIAADWVDHEQLGERVLACTLRSDRVKYGGHHQVYFRGDVARRLYVALSVFSAGAKSPHYGSVEKIPFEKLDDYFLMVTVDGVLYFNDLFAVRANCLNLTGRQRSRVDDMLREMRLRAIRP
jgi:hypothetical protein